MTKSIWATLHQNFKYVVFLAVLLLATPCPLVTAQRADGLIGEWKVTAETPEGDKTSLWTFKKTESGLSGNSVGEDGEEYEMLSLIHI